MIITTRYETSKRFEVSAAWNKACGRPAVAEVFKVVCVEEHPGARFPFVTVACPDADPHRFYGDQTKVFMACRGRFVD